MDHDHLGIGDESPRERLARENMEADLKLLAALRRARDEQGLSQTDLGRLLGISQASVSAFEAESDPKLSTIRRYAFALNVAISHDVKSCGRVSSTQPAAASQRTVEVGAAEAKRNDFAMAA
jgi:transcriptional regulator with XRE-family HTH domain